MLCASPYFSTWSDSDIFCGTFSFFGRPLFFAGNVALAVLMPEAAEEEEEDEEAAVTQSPRVLARVRVSGTLSDAESIASGAFCFRGDSSAWSFMAMTFWVRLR